MQLLLIIWIQFLKKSYNGNIKVEANLFEININFVKITKLNCTFSEC